MHGASRRGVLLGVAALAGCAAPPRSSARVKGATAPSPPAPPPLPPADLQARLTDVGSTFDGRLGVAIHDVGAGWTAGFDGARLYPQQSVAKLWTALAVFDAVDRGRLKLEQTVRVSAADMSVFHQPLRERTRMGPVDVSVDALLSGALAQSDNACDDVLIRLVGGDRAVQRVVDARGLGAIRAGPQERELQSWLGGVAWRPEYVVGDAFERARDLVPAEVRRARMAAYLADPPEGAAPDAMVRALGLLSQGRLLSPASTARFLAILQATTTGPNRLKAGLPPGWGFAHKTGTGQDFAGLSTGYNDVGIATAPNGAVFTLAAMIASTSRPIPERMLAMQAVSRALADWKTGALPA